MSENVFLDDVEKSVGGLTGAEQVPLVQGMDDTKAVGLLQKCAILKSLQTKLPKLYGSLTPDQLGLPATIAENLSGLTTPGRVRLFSANVIGEFKRIVARIWNWVNNNTIDSPFGRLVTADQWEPVGGVVVPEDWDKYSPRPGLNSTFQENYQYSMHVLQRSLDDAVQNYDKYIEELRVEYVELASSVYKQVLTLIRNDPKAFPKYAVITGEDGLLLPAINGTPISEEGFINLYWENIQPQLPTREDFVVTNNPSDKGFMVKYQLVEIPEPVMNAITGTHPTFSASVITGTGTREANIEIVTKAILQKVYGYMISVASNLVSKGDEHDGLPARSVAQMRNLYRNIRRLNVLDDDKLAKLADSVEAVSEQPVSERNWADLKAVLEDVLKVSYEEASSIGLDITIEAPVPPEVVAEDSTHIEAIQEEPLTPDMVVPEVQQDILIEDTSGLPDFLRELIPSAARAALVE